MGFTSSIEHPLVAPASPRGVEHLNVPGAFREVASAQKSREYRLVTGHSSHELAKIAMHVKRVPAASRLHGRKEWSRPALHHHLWGEGD